MDKTLKKRKLSGEITVFLILMLVALLPLMGMLVESARIHVLRNYWEGNLRLATESIFTKFCRPLWDEYHLFLMEGEGESGGISDKKVVAEIEHYLGSTSGRFYQPQFVELPVEEQVLFTDYEGELYLNQMVEYMKSHFVSTILEGDKAVLEEQEKAQNSAKLMEEKQELEERLAVTNRSVLNLIHLIDGFEVVNGRIKVKSTFVKQLCSGEANMSNTGISRSEIWEKLKGRYLSAEDMTHAKAGQIIGCIDAALAEIKSIKKEEGELDGEIRSFTDHYKNEKEGLSAGISQVIEREMGNLDIYEEKEGTGVSMTSQAKRMESVLIQNKMVLEEFLSYEDEEMGKAVLTRYNISGLQFNYQHLILKKQKSPVKAMEKVLGKGVLSMVQENETKVSESRIPAMPIFFAGVEAEGKDTTIEKAMEIGYYQAHFTSYLDCYKEGAMPFGYQQEYIIVGGDTDTEALEGTASRIFLSRQMFNYLYLLTDSEKSNEAYMAALAMVGFSGMEPLVSATKHLILLNWARAEALVDVSLLLSEREIGLWKTRETFLVTFVEMVGFHKGTIMEKVKSYSLPGGIARQGYKDYLRIFLYSTEKNQRRNRSLHLIQENIRYQYYDDFYIGNGLVGIKIKGIWKYEGGPDIVRTISYCY